MYWEKGSLKKHTNCIYYDGLKLNREPKIKSKKNTLNPPTLYPYPINLSHNNP